MLRCESVRAWNKSKLLFDLFSTETFRKSSLSYLTCASAAFGSSQTVTSLSEGRVLRVDSSLNVFMMIEIKAEDGAS